ncbi:hypothetical protein SKAU_G00204900 [Synaphobranchus kaupii]|uniref:Glycosyl transferase 64 domain-containing protein n=1 Tax=Synaphobranchus kaupii TaxID=118154 RepID=A0A9Q1FGC1_SYNKA|nr:hypothetical protein SKAU_G00204900 [Synaphobranchus kaupii]
MRVFRRGLQGSLPSPCVPPGASPPPGAPGGGGADRAAPPSRRTRPPLRRRDSRDAGARRDRAPPAKEDSFTIVMQTYNRTDVLLKLLNHYQAEQSANRMRNRLQAFSEIDTDAVLMLDDDTLVSAPDLSFAFSVWKLFPEQIVGDPEEAGGDRYSMVLVGAAFFHRRYLELFQQQPAQVHALVDETQNCDDIAMNFVVAMQLGAGPRAAGVFVKPVDLRNLERDAHSGYLGMWHRPEHLLQRSYCLNRLAHIYGSMPLRYSNLMLSQFGFPSYANHKARS